MRSRNTFHDRDGAAQMAGRAGAPAARLRWGRRRRARVKALALRHEMELAELRRALQFSQAELARTLHIDQAAVAKIERRTDMYVSTLCRIVEAMAGALEIVARFPDRSVRITTFGDPREDGSDAAA
jgi:DNA-binding XRE family transcriptional regulator